MKATDCKVFLTPRPRPPMVDALLAAAGDEITSYEIPTVEELLQRQAPAFPYNKTLKDAQRDPLTVLHTSGSTGLPKPVTWVQGFAPSYAKQFRLDPPGGYESVDRSYMGNRAFVVFPPFHVSNKKNQIYQQNRILIDRHPGSICRSCPRQCNLQ